MANLAGATIRNEFVISDASFPRLLDCSVMAYPFGDLTSSMKILRPSLGFISYAALEYRGFMF
ncbi:hypothetical protein [Marinobacterium aestuariivivens]|uniref:hypothetical protein n=1 Tax=Marinobacterium aestuariivivens TaxID=1698799 RepID=UPI0036D277B9